MAERLLYMQLYMLHFTTTLARPGDAMISTLQMRTWRLSVVVSSPCHACLY